MEQLTKENSVSNEKKLQINWTQLMTFLIAIAALGVSIKSCVDSKNNFEIENRAYIYVESVTPSNIYELFFDVNFKNYGKTPAKNIVLSEVRVYPEKLEFLDSPLKMDSSEIALLIAGDERSIKMPANKTYYSIAEQLGRVYVVGKITYYDIFDNAHFTQFAGWLRAHGDDQYFNLQGALNSSK